MNSLADIDPQWAWGAVEPSRDQPWDRRMAAHLYRRAGFGADTQMLDQAVQSSPVEVVRDLIAQNTEPADFQATADALTKTILASGDPKQLSSAWAYRLLFTPNQLLEKATLFWHGHFATGADKVEDAGMMWTQNQLLRQYALGRFEPLVLGIARDPAMLVYLDSTSNRKAHPNENFARELMELFCLGEGNYVERDVQELARCFTGWEIKNKKFRKNRYQHDSGVKNVLGQMGGFDGEDGVRIVLEQPAMPRFICRKLFRFFVCDEPSPPDRLLQPLADQFRSGGLRIGPVIQTLLASNLFFSEHAIGRKIRSPVELIVGLLRTLNGTTNANSLAEGTAKIGQGLFFPPNVKGWDGGRAWVNSSTLLGRANLIYRILNDDVTRFAGGKLSAYFQSLDLNSTNEIIDRICELLVAVPLSDDVRSRIAKQVSSGSDDQEERIRNAIHAIATIPEFQLC